MHVCFTFISSSHCLYQGALDLPLLASGAGADASMAAKAGDNPDSLMTLTTVFCLRNLRKTVCYQGFGNKLCLRPDVFLPSEICDKLVNKYVTGGHFWDSQPVTFVYAEAPIHFEWKCLQVYGVGPHRQQLQTRGKLLPTILGSSQHQADPGSAQRRFCMWQRSRGHKKTSKIIHLNTWTSNPAAQARPHLPIDTSPQIESYCWDRVRFHSHTWLCSQKHIQASELIMSFLIRQLEDWEKRRHSPIVERCCHHITSFKVEWCICCDVWCL